MPPRNLGTLVRDRRQQLGLTQAQLALRTGHGTTQVHISRIETGSTIEPRRHRLVALATALEVTPSVLFVRAGLITAADVQGSPHVAGDPVPARAAHPRASSCPPLGVMTEWETATVFACA